VLVIALDDLVTRFRSPTTQGATGGCVTCGCALPFALFIVAAISGDTGGPLFWPAIAMMFGFIGTVVGGVIGALVARRRAKREESAGYPSFVICAQVKIPIASIRRRVGTEIKQRYCLRFSGQLSDRLALVSDRERTLAWAEDHLIERQAEAVANWSH